MLNLEELLDALADIPEKDREKMQLIVRDYDGNLHRLCPAAELMYAYQEGYVIVDMHGEEDSGS